MSKVYITTTALENDPHNPYSRSDYHRLIRASEADIHGTNKICSKPKDADIILFIGSSYNYRICIRLHPLVKKYPNKCFVIDGNDNSLPSLPGLYMGLPKNIWKKDAYRTGFYLRIFENDFIIPTPIDNNCSLDELTSTGPNSTEVEPNVRAGTGLLVPTPESVTTDGLPEALCSIDIPVEYSPTSDGLK